MVDGIDRQTAFTKQRDCEKKSEVLAYFERSRDILLKIRAAGGAAPDGQPIAVRRDAQDKSEKNRAADQAADDLKELLKPLPAKSAEEALKTFEVADGFHMEVVAKEPQVCDPIAAAFDENGELYVCEDRDYPYRPKPGEKPLSTIRILRDTNGDGVFEESHVFADGLLWASGVIPWKGGVFVAAAPDIWYLKDTDGDFKADIRVKVFTGFGTQNQQAMLNNLAFGPDHMIYGSTAGNGGTVHSAAHPDDKGVSVNGHDFRFDPGNSKLETVTGTVQFGNSFDDWGNRFMCSQSSPLLHAVLPEQYLARNPHLPVPSAIDNLAGSPVPIYRISPVEGWRQIRSNRRIAQDRPSTADGVSHHVVDAAAGVTVYRGAAYGDKYYGNVFVCDAENNLIHRRTLTPSGATFQSKRADENTEFVRSSDNWFRPVNLVNAPDGTLYVLDMSREIIESIHIPSDVVKYLDLTNGRNQGRIYRLAPPKFRYTAPRRLGQASTAELVAALESPNSWSRDTAHRLIFEGQDQSCVPALRDLVKNSSLPQARMLAMWSLQGLRALAADDLEAALADQSSEVRCQAIRLAEPHLDASPRLLAKVLSHVDDPNSRVCFQLAFSLGETKDPRAVSALVRIASKYAADIWIRTAILSSSSEIADKLLLELVRDSEFTGTHEGTFLLSQLAQIVGARRHADEIARIIESLGARGWQHPLRPTPGRSAGIG